MNKKYNKIWNRILRMIEIDWKILRENDGKFWIYILRKNKENAERRKEKRWKRHCYTTVYRQREGGLEEGSEIYWVTDWLIIVEITDYPLTSIL